MKKFTAILLAIITVFSLSMPALASNVLEDMFGTTEEDEAAALTYGIYFESGTVSLESITYMPTHTLTFDAPVIVTLTLDTPIAVDHTWVAWKDKSTGKLYYPGDEIEVYGEVHLEAIWEEKTDNIPSFLRAVIAGLQTLARMIEKFLGAFDAINATKPIETTAPSTTLAA